MSGRVGQDEILKVRIRARKSAERARTVTLASRSRILTVIVASFFASATAFADQPPNVIGASAVLKLSLVGHIRSHCGFASMPPSSANLNDLTQGGSLELDFKLDCNAGFAVAVASSNGGLKRVSSPGSDDIHVDGFATALDYDVGLAYQTDLGTVAAHCPASSLSAGSPTCAFYGAGAGHGLSSGDGVAVDAPGSLTLKWQPPAHTRLVAGNYKDTITITVGAQL
jgi:hypothetical protein